MRRNALFAAILALAACRGATSPRGAAEQFIDKFYVELSPEQALPVTADSAAESVKEAIRLRAGAGGVDPQQHPHVYWERLGEPNTEADDRRLLRYRLRIDSGGAPMQKEVVIQVAKRGDQWKVTNYSERDEAAPPR